MDMKRILQALDGASTKPVEGVNSMSKFLRVVKEAELNQPSPQQDPNFAKYVELMSKYDMLSAEMASDTSGLGIEKNSSPEFVQQVNAIKAQADQLAGPNAQAWDQARKITPQQSQQQLATQLSEGANPHKVSLPVQMAMQHYQPVSTTKQVVNSNSAFKKYFKLAEDEFVERKEARRAELNKYAAIIAERVRLKEGKGVAKSTPKKQINEEENSIDVVSIDVPLLIRLLEYAREDAQTDMDLHNVAERLIGLSQEGRTLDMNDYENIVGGEEQPAEEPVLENKNRK